MMLFLNEMSRSIQSSVYYTFSRPSPSYLLSSLNSYTDLRITQASLHKAA